MKINIVYVVSMMLGLVIFTNIAMAQDSPSDRKKAKIVSSIYQITYGSDEICQQFAPDQAGQVREATERFRKKYPELMQLVEQSPYLDQAKQFIQATIKMIAKAASPKHESACQESLWLLKQLEAEGAKQEIDKMISELKLKDHGTWIDTNGKPIINKENMQSDGDFAAHLVLTSDENQFRQSWNSTKGTPKLKSADTVSLGSSVSAMLLFHGCSPNSNGVCDVVAEFILESPDGIKIPAGGGPVWSSAPMPTGMVQLGHASMTVGFDSIEPLGIYKIIANVKDKISGRTLSVTTKLNVIKAEGLPRYSDIKP